MDPDVRSLSAGPRALLRWAGLACLLVAAWQFVPRPVAATEARPGPLVVLVDASSSVRAQRPDWLRWVRELLAEEAARASREGRAFCLVSFASEVGRVAGPEPPEDFLARLRGRDGAPLDPRDAAGAPDATRLARALEVAAEVALAPGHRPGSVVVAGTERWTDEDPRPVLARLGRDGVLVERRAAPPAHWHDLAVDALALPPAIEEGAPLLARARIVHRPGGAPLEEVWLAVRIRNGGFLRELRVPVTLDGSGSAQEVPIALGPAGAGRTEVQVEVRQAPGPDALAANDVARAATRARGERVLLVVGEPEGLGEARRWLTPSGTSGLPGLQFLFATPEELPRHVDEVDALVAYDLRPSRLAAPLVRGLLERGGGFLATAGWSFLEDWRPGQPDVGVLALLPGRPAPLDLGRRDVVLLVDGSGSMEGAPFDTVRAASLDLVRLALPADRVSLRFFTTGLLSEQVIKEPSPAGAAEPRATARAEEATRRLLGLHVPSGQTYLFASLEGFVRERAASDPRALAFVLSDGLERDYTPDPDARARALRTACLERDVELVPIAVGARADLVFLQRLARPGESVWQPEGLEDLRQVFRREISGAQWRGGPALAVRWAPAPEGSLAADLRGAAADPPPLERFLKNEARPWAEVVWRGDRGEPLLLVGRVGRGRVALFASLPGTGWGERWTGPRGWGQPAEFAGLLRWLARGAARAGDGPRLLQEPGGLVLEGLGPRWPARVDAEVVDGLDASEPVLARLAFLPAGSPADPDPLLRRAVARPVLGPESARALPLVRLVDPEGGVHRFPLDAGRPREVRDGGEPLPERWLRESAPAAEERAAGRTIDHRLPDRGAAAWLAAGLLALFCGFLRLPGAGGRGDGSLAADGQGTGAPGR